MVRTRGGNGARNEMKASNSPDEALNNNNNNPRFRDLVARVEELEREIEELRQQVYGQERGSSQEERHEQSWHPFTDEIMDAPFPESLDLKALQIDRYGGSSNPEKHLMAFNAQMLLITSSDAVMCRVFPSTLKETALTWYSDLPPRSIHSFDDFATKFKSNFMSYCY